MTHSVLKILQHALGRDQYGETLSRSEGGADYRNHFVTGEGCADLELCRAAVAQGLMKEFPPTALSGGGNIFVVTEAGKAFIKENSPKRPPEPKLTRSQKRYRDFLRADCGLSFREWLGIRNKPRRSVGHDYSRGFLAADLVF